MILCIASGDEHEETPLSDTDDGDKATVDSFPYSVNELADAANILAPGGQLTPEPDTLEATLWIESESSSDPRVGRGCEQAETVSGVQGPRTPELSATFVYAEFPPAKKSPTYSQAERLTPSVSKSPELVESASPDLSPTVKIAYANSISLSQFSPELR